MRAKLTALAAVALTVGVSALAHAGPVPVAVYSFQSVGDVAAFQKQAGARCTRKWVKNKQMSIAVGPKTNSCAFRTSVVGDSTDPGSDMEISAQANLGSGISAKLMNKAYVGVAARSSETAGYELRLRPAARTWQLFRDPKGAVGPTLFQSGKGVKQGKRPLSLALRAFDYGSATSTTVTGFVNGKAVINFTDSQADQPDGRRSVITTGVKGTGAGTGVVGIFDNVAIKVPNPF
jgi:hypothetical protein